MMMMLNTMTMMPMTMAMATVMMTTMTMILFSLNSCSAVPMQYMRSDLAWHRADATDLLDLAMNTAAG